MRAFVRTAGDHYHLIVMGGHAAGKDPGKVPTTPDWSRSRAAMQSVVAETEAGWPVGILPAMGDSGWRLVAFDFDFADGVDAELAQSQRERLERLVFGVSGPRADGAFALASLTPRNFHLYCRVSDSFAEGLADRKFQWIGGDVTVEVKVRKGVITLWRPTDTMAAVLAAADAPPQDDSVAWLISTLSGDALRAEIAQTEPIPAPVPFKPAHIPDSTATAFPGMEIDKGLANWPKLQSLCPEAARAAADHGGNSREYCRTVVIGLTKFCEGGREAMHAICSGHPRYNRNDNDLQFESWGAGAGKAAPPTCDTIDAAAMGERGQGCKATCPHHATGACPFKSPIALGFGERRETNRDGLSVSNELENTRKAECVVQACDFVGIEPYHDEFTQSVVFHRRDLGGKWEKFTDRTATLAQSDAEAVCRVPAGGGKTKAAVFGDAKFVKLLNTLGDARFKARHVNVVRDLLDTRYPAHECTETDYNTMRRWFLEEWDATADSESDREIAMRVTEQFGVNLWSRAYDPGALVRFHPLLLGHGEKGKSDFVRSILPEEAQELKLFPGSLDLTQEIGNLVKQQAGFWLAEYAEIDSIHGAQIAQIKDFLTMTEQGARRLYDDGLTLYRLTAVGCATGNLDRQPLPDSRELKMRLVHIEVGNSPFGDEDGKYGGRAQNYFRESGMRDTLWRGWGYAYHHLGKRSGAGLGGLTDAVLRRADPFTYQKSEMDILIDDLVDRVREQVRENGMPAIDIVKEGATAAQIVTYLKEIGRDLPPRAAQELGNKLRPAGFVVVKEDRKRGHRWIHPDLLETGTPPDPEVPF